MTEIIGKMYYDEDGVPYCKMQHQYCCTEDGDLFIIEEGGIRGVESVKMRPRSCTMSIDITHIILKNCIENRRFVYINEEPSCIVHPSS
jgi:hypothetical protein